MKLTFIILICIFAGGCASLLKLQGQAATKAAQAIEYYCENTDATFREKFESELNSKALPNRAIIFCAE